MNENPQFIKIKVYANSKKNAIIQTGENSFEIFVKSKAQRNLANKQAVEILAEKLGENPNKLKIIKGAHICKKLVKIL